LALPQNQVVIDFESPGEREVWIADRMTLPPASLKTGEALLTLPKQGGGNDRIYVWDRKTGNVASRSVSQFAVPWKVKPEDYQLVGKVTVQVEHAGKPVAVAFVKLKDAAGEKDRQIDPSKDGKAVFFGVRPGEVTVTVRYNSQGADAEPAKQSFVLPLKRSEPDPTYTISLSQSVDTVGGPKSAAGEAKPESGPKDAVPAQDGQASRGNPIGNIIVFLLGLGVAAAAIWFGLKYLKDNQDKVKGQLQKVGVQIPDDPLSGSGSDPVAQPPVPVPPAPPEKILLEDADPMVPIAPTSVAPMTASEPSLVMDNGDVFAIPEGETTVGRDAACGLALVAESTVSRKHATLIRNGNVVQLRDDGSSNGTFVNGAKVDSVDLKAGDQIQFGQAKFRFEG